MLAEAGHVLSSYDLCAQLSPSYLTHYLNNMLHLGIMQSSFGEIF